MKRIIYILLLSLLTGSFTQAQSFKLPAYQKFTLKNGLTVYLMEQHEVPIISVSAILPAKEKTLTADRPGRYGLTAHPVWHA